MTAIATKKLGFSVRLKTDFDTALQMVKDALKVEGFGVLTEIDMQDTLKKKIDVDFRPYKILGACNPPLAYRALTTTQQTGLLLPCNVVVTQGDDDQIEVSIVDPMSMLGIVDHPDLDPIAQEARTHLVRVAVSLQNNS